MPELPEVEYARRSVERWGRGRVIVEAVTPATRVIRPQAPEQVQEILRGARIEGAVRRGKQLLVLLDGARALYLHLGMSGALARVERGALAEVPHLRLALVLDDGHAIALRDARMFGRVAAGPRAVLEAEVFAALGPDALDSPLDGAELRARLSRTRRPIKVALMDQSLLAGIGNIQASEALFRAKLSPELPAAALDPRAAARLARGIAESLRFTLDRLEETDEVRYVSEGAENPFLVYGREGEPCPRCRRAKIERDAHGGRSTFFCPRCQARPKERAPRGR
jgi:formamidopyrimidine-DNA glycosylase